jgi:hypothetical protein
VVPAKENPDKPAPSQSRAAVVRGDVITMALLVPPGHMRRKTGATHAKHVIQ